MNKYSLLIAFKMLILFGVSAISQDVAKEIINTSEEMPRFPGCEGKKTKEEKYKCADEKLMNYIYSNLNYPKEGSIEGRVTVRFVVTKEGKIDNV